jgi:hypothetical protein
MKNNLNHKKTQFFCKRVSLLGFLCGVLIIFSGCASNVETFNSSSGLGKQLEDIQQAYKTDAISEDEYKKAKEILIDHYK